MSKSITIGIIAEDDSDVDCLKEILRKLCPSRSLSFKKNVGKGCGTIPTKCSKWAAVLRDRGCIKLIVLRDSDGKDAKKLEADIRKALNPVPIADNVIVVAVQELENWLLSDIASIHKTFSDMKQIPSEINSPENIARAKEHLYNFVRKQYKKQYMHTIHNQRIASIIDVTKIKSKCPSFAQLANFAEAF